MVHRTLRYLHDATARHPPALSLFHKPTVETLLLFTLALAEHPSHRLVEDYRLVRAGTSNPVTDACLAATLLAECPSRRRGEAGVRGTGRHQGGLLRM